MDEKLAELLAEVTISTQHPSLPRRILSDARNNLELVREIKEAVCYAVPDCTEKRQEFEV